jgi:transposase-like protein
MVDQYPTDFPKTQLEFEGRFSTEEACRSYLISLRWPHGFSCPNCGHTHGWVNNRNLIECSNCHYQGSLTAGTILEGTRKPLRMWFIAMWWVCTQKTGGSAVGLKRILGLGSYKTAWTWLHKIRTAMIRAGREKLSHKVQIDDAFIGGEESGVSGRESFKKARIVVAVEIKETGRGLGRIRIRHIPDFSASSLIPFVMDFVEPGSVVQTDGWRGYSSLEEKGFQHIIIRANSSPETPLPHVNRVISLLKRWLLGTHQGRVSQKHLQHYLDEFVFRHNRRKSKHVGLLFQRIVKQSSESTPFPYKKIVGLARGPSQHELKE